MAFKTVPAPHVNVNDVELVLVEWLVRPWQAVEKGTPLCVVETTKAVLTIESEDAGFVYPVAAESKTVRVGEPLAHVFPTDDPKQIEALGKDGPAQGGAVVSKKARELMDKSGLSASDFPPFTAISSDTVIAKLRELQRRPAGEGRRTAPETLGRLRLKPDSVLVYGEPNQALLAIDALEARGRAPAAFMDEAPAEADFCGLPALAPDALKTLRDRGLRFAYVCGRDERSIEVQARACEDAGLELLSVVHPSAAVSPRSRLGKGVFVGALAAVGPDVEIGDFTRLLCGASIAHHSRVGRFASICDGSRLGGNVEVGDRSFLGIGVNVNKRIRIGRDCTIVSGATVTDHVPDGQLVRHPAASSRPTSPPAH